MQDLETIIRERAYHLWVEGGCEQGHAETHWLSAQREVLSASLETISHVKVGKKPAKARASRKKRAA